MSSNDPRAEILGIIRRVNAAWLEGPPGEIVARVAPCFAPDIVICGPNFQVVARGRDACAASYESFVRMATVREFVAPDPEIHVTGDTAVAACPWSMTYTLNDATYTEKGHDLLVFDRHGSEWLVVWRAMLPAPA
jgi:ketosteroid isomerase-like protein